MHIAADSLNRVKTLLKTQEINQLDHQGKSVLTKALEQKFSQKEILFLLDLGADVNLKEQDGKTVLDRLENKYNKLVSGNMYYYTSLPVYKEEMIPVMQKMLEKDTHAYLHPSLCRVLNYSLEAQRIRQEENLLGLQEICQINRKELIIGYGEQGNALLMSAKDISQLLKHKKEEYRQCFLEKLEKLVNVPMSLSQPKLIKPQFVKEFLPIVLNLLEKDEYLDRHKGISRIVKEQAPKEWNRMISVRLNKMNVSHPFLNGHPTQGVLKDIQAKMIVRGIDVSSHKNHQMRKQELSRAS